MSKQRVICVVGMHRSGTSCLAGCLEQAGVFLGQVSRKNPHNLKGNHEQQEIVALHEKVLDANDGAWDRPPKSVVWSDECKRDRDRIIASYSGQAIWGFKDPRSMLTWQGWREAIPGIEFVGTFRHPHAVAMSLTRRSLFPHDKGLELWFQYNSILRHLVEQYGVPVISFDLPPETYGQKLETLRGKLGLAGERKIDFFDQGLRKNADTDALDAEPLPHSVRGLYEYFKRIAI